MNTHNPPLDNQTHPAIQSPIQGKPVLGCDFKWVREEKIFGG